MKFCTPCGNTVVLQIPEGDDSLPELLLGTKGGVAVFAGDGGLVWFLRSPLVRRYRARLEGLMVRIALSS